MEVFNTAFALLLKYATIILTALIVLTVIEGILKELYHWARKQFGNKKGEQPEGKEKGRKEGANQPARLR